jgi:hypothetical protein
MTSQQKPPIRNVIEIIDGDTADEVADKLEELQQWLNRSIDDARGATKSECQRRAIRSLVAARQRLAELRHSLRHSRF